MSHISIVSDDFKCTLDDVYSIYRDAVKEYNLRLEWLEFIRSQSDGTTGFIKTIVSHENYTSEAYQKVKDLESELEKFHKLVKQRFDDREAPDKKTYLG